MGIAEIALRPCPHCGAGVLWETRACPRCGAALEPPVGSPEGVPPRSPDAGRPEGAGRTPSFDANPPGLSRAGAAAIGLAVTAVLLVALMVTGVNERIPYLHADTSPPGVEVYGARLTISYLFVANGTLLAAAESSVCGACPLSVGPGATFGYLVNFTNVLNGSLDVTSLAAAPPFQLENPGVRLPYLLPAGISLALPLELRAPTTAGGYLLTLQLDASVS